MWRKLKFLHIWINFKFLHMTDVEKSEISFILCTIYGILLHFTLFCWKICFIFADLRCFFAKLFFLQFTSPYLDNHSRPEAGHEGEEDKAQHLDEPNIQGVLHSLPDRNLQLINS